MKPQELRLKNYVNFNSTIVRVMTISNKYINVRNQRDYLITFLDFSKYILPIPITEQWLLDLGFEYWVVDKAYFYKDYFFHTELPEEMKYYLPYFNMDIYIGSVKIQYVHQLQNFYFALTGKELSL